MRFWDLTPDDFDRAAMGYQQRIENEWYGRAWLASRILSGLVSKAPSPDKLLGRAFKNSRRRSRQAQADED